MPHRMRRIDAAYCYTSRMSVVCVSLLGTSINPTETDELIKMGQTGWLSEPFIR